MRLNDLPFDIRVLLTTALIVISVACMFLTVQVAWIATMSNHITAAGPFFIGLGTAFVMIGAIDAITLMWKPRRSADSE